MIVILDACQQQPCKRIAHTVANECKTSGIDIFECVCIATFFWDVLKLACIYG